MSSLLVLGLAVVAACSEDGEAADGAPDGDGASDGSAADGEPGDGSEPGDGDEGSLYAALSMVFGTEGGANTSYVSLVDELAGQTLDFATSREFAGNADLWLHEGALFVTSAEDQTVTKFALEGSELVEQGVLSFAGYGFSSTFGFWLNSFVSADKAYMLNPSLELVTWNPRTMEITGDFALEGFENVNALAPYPGYTDRSAVLRDGKLFLTVYFSDDTYFAFAQNTAIVVIDVATDMVVDRLDAACPGLDFATQDEAGNLYFSSWIFAPGGAALLDQPATCVAKIPAGDTLTVETAFTVKDATGGHEGGALRYLGANQGIVSVLDVAHAGGSTMAGEVTFGANWRFWRYDFTTGAATVLEGFDWNAGAAYTAEAGDQRYLLVPASNYASTEIHALDERGEPTSVLKAGGWTTRLFKVR